MAQKNTTYIVGVGILVLTTSPGLDKKSLDTSYIFFSTMIHLKSVTFALSPYSFYFVIIENSVQTNDFFSFFCTESVYFGCKITPSKCNLFARWFFYLIFSVFYSLYSGFIKFVKPFLLFYLRAVLSCLTDYCCLITYCESFFS